MLFFNCFGLDVKHCMVVSIATIGARTKKRQFLAAVFIILGKRRLERSLENDLIRLVEQRVGHGVLTTRLVDAIVRGDRASHFTGSVHHFYGVTALEHSKINVARLRRAGQVGFSFSRRDYVAVFNRRPLNFNRHIVDALTVGIFNFDEDMVLAVVLARGQLANALNPIINVRRGCWFRRRRIGWRRGGDNDGNKAGRSAGRGRRKDRCRRFGRGGGHSRRRCIGWDRRFGGRGRLRRCFSRRGGAGWGGGGCLHKW